MKLSQVIDELVEERGLERSVLGEIVCAGILAAYQKKYPDLSLEVVHDVKSDELVVSVKKQVVGSIEDVDREIGLKKARLINRDAQVGDTVSVPFEGRVGRIEILKAKQVIAQGIRDVESAATYECFKDKVGAILYGAVHKAENAGVTVKLNDETLAFLPKSLMIPGEQCPVGHTIKALLREVLLEPRNENQLILDRVSPDFVLRLFELEIPEVFEKIVEIKKIARIPGYKSKILLVSHDKNIDPVGTCIGIGGVRIKPILRELNGEKVDVIRFGTSTEDLVADALKPAAVNRVEIDPERGALVWLDDDQRSAAIGKAGQNIALASRLVDLSITLVAPGANAEVSVHDESVVSDEEGASGPEGAGEL